MANRKLEPYDKPRIFHDSTETFSFKPDEAEREAFRNRRKADSRMGWLKRRMESWLKDEDAERRRKLDAVLKLVEQDKVLIALEEAYDARIEEIRRYYLEANAKENRKNL